MTSCFKKVLFWSALILGFENTFAFEALSLNSLNFKLNPDNHEGRVLGSELFFQSGPLKVSSQSPDLTFSLKEGSFSTSLEGVDLSFDFGKDSFFAGLSQIETENLDVEYFKDTRLRLENNGLLIGHTRGSQYVPRLTLTCAANAQKSLVQDISGQCLHLGRLQVPVLNFDELSGSGVAKSFGVSNMSLDELEDIDLMILNNSFNLSFKARLLFNWKIKASGSVTYYDEQGVIDIHLDKAKVGFISLKGRLLKELAEGDFDSITVKGDHILIKI